MTPIEVENKIDDLSFERWAFIEIDNNLYLNRYYLYRKENKKKRKYLLVGLYDRLRSSFSNMTEEEVKLPNWVKKKAWWKYAEQIKVLKWSEKGNEVKSYDMDFQLFKDYYKALIEKLKKHHLENIKFE